MERRSSAGIDVVCLGRNERLRAEIEGVLAARRLTIVSAEPRADRPLALARAAVTLALVEWGAVDGPAERRRLAALVPGLHVVALVERAPETPFVEGADEWILLPLAPDVATARIALVEAWAARLAHERAEADERFAALASLAGGGVAITAQGRIVAVNDECARLWGASEEALRGRHVMSLVPESQHENIQREMRADDAVVAFEYEAVRATGETFPLHLAARLAHLDGEEVRVALVRDLTETKRKAAALISSIEHLRLSLDAGELGTWEWNIATGAVTWSESVEPIFGLARGAFRGTLEAFMELVHPDDVAQVERTIAAAMTGDGTFRIEHRTTRPSGEVRWIAGRGYVFRDAGGTPVRILGAVMDITDRRRMDHELAARAERLRISDERSQFLARATTDVIYDWVFATSEITWNDNLRLLFGYDFPGNVSPLGWWSERIHPDDRARVLGGLDDVTAAGNKHWTGEYRFRRADGSYAFVLDRGMFLDDPNGKPSRMVGSMMDVTERKEMQARLVASDRMASVGTLAAGVAHEINNPLTYVIGSIAMATRLIGKVEEVLRSGGDARAVLERIGSALDAAHEGADRVRHIVRDLKTFSRSDDDRRGMVDVRRILESSISMAQNELRHRAALVRHFGDVPSVEANESRLGQVMLNLLVNAAHAIPEGAADRHEVRVSTRTDARGFAVIEVRDSGAGISPDVMGRIFDPFFTTKPVGEGTGLGLAICHSIVGDLGGDIVVESEPGKGAAFVVRLPPARGSERPPPPVRAARPPSARRSRVLVIDDEPRVSQSIEETLAGDHDVARMDSARKALARLVAGERYDAILCDLMMPDMTGMELFDATSQIDSAQASRMVFITGGVFTPRARAFIETVKNRCLEKPYEEELLRAVVADVVGEADDD